MERAVLQPSRLLLLLVAACLFSSAAFAQLDTTELYDLVKLDVLNTRYHESGPVVSPDGNTLYWFVDNHPENSFYGKEAHNQDIWYANRQEDGSWSAPIHMGNPLNQSQFNQVLTVLNEGNTLLIRGGTSKNAKGLAVSTRRNGKWSRPSELNIKDFKKLNTGIFSGGTLSSDGAVLLLYFSEKPGAKFSDLYVSFRENDLKYSRPIKLALSTFKDEFGPFLAADDQTMYFASNRYDGFGDADIWVTTRLDDTWLKWSEPVNLGAPVNTKGFDAYFSIDANGQNAYTTRAYMSADGGSLDILGLVPKPEIVLEGTVKDKKTGAPIAGLVGLRLHEGGLQYLEADAQGRFRKTLRNKGIYYFDLDETGYQLLTDSLDLRAAEDQQTYTKELLLDPIPAEIILFGYVTDSETNEALLTTVRVSGADQFSQEVETDENGYYSLRLPEEGTYQLQAAYEGYYDTQLSAEVRGVQDYYLEVGQDIPLEPVPVPMVLGGIAYNFKTNEVMQVGVRVVAALGGFDQSMETLATNGYYSVELPDSGWYYIYAGAEGFLNFTDSIEVYVPLEQMEFVKDVPLVPIEIGVTVRLNKIYFDFDKTDLRPESFPELDRLVELMQLNSTVSIEIAGHTDDKGSDDYNSRLSQGRAESVMAYLLEQGIDAQRVQAVGYGESKPEVANDSDANRQINRRVEFTVLGK